MASITLPLSAVEGGQVHLVSPSRQSPKGAQIMASLEDEERFGPSRFSRLEHWIDAIRPFTFETAILSLSGRQAKAILRCKEAGDLELMMRDQHFRQTHPGVRVMDTRTPTHPEVRHLLSRDDRAALDEVERMIDEEVEKMGGAVFVRTSGLSYKDAIVGSQKFRELLIQGLREREERQHEEAGVERDTQDLLMYIRLLSHCGRVESGREAVRFLCSSNRTYHDISKTSLMSGDDDSARVKLIIRKWLDVVDPIFEFRTFVVDGRITCIQTYCGPNCYEASIAKNRFVIRDKILAYFDAHLKPILSSLSPPPIFTIDFYFSTDLSQMGVVEFNEGPPTAGSLFYDFQSERDVAIMEGRAWGREGEEGEREEEERGEKGEEERGEKGEEKRYLPDLRVQMEPVLWPNERMHSHIRYLFDELRGRDLSWTQKEPNWGHDVSNDPTILPIMCLCQECDNVFERLALRVCTLCVSEHFLCAPCFETLKEKESECLKEHVFVQPSVDEGEKREGGREREGGGEGEGDGSVFCVIL